MKTNYISIQLILFLLISMPALAQSEIESSYANATTVTSTETQEEELRTAEEDAYSIHTIAAQEAVRTHLESTLSYSELLYAHRAEGRVILILDIDADGQVSATGIRQSLSAESDAIALQALEGLVLPEGPYLGARTILIPVDFMLE